MNCSDLKAHLKLLHVIEDPTCSCQTGIEDTYHYFFMCPLYHACRQTLINVINSVSDFSLTNVLYGDDSLDTNRNQRIFKAVHEFIENSGRFS